MSELLVLALKLAFLALLWLFVLLAVNVIRTDLLGRRTVAPAGASAAALPSSTSRRGRRRARPTALTVVEGPQLGLHLPLGASLLIGRTPEADLVLDDDYLSSEHATITTDANGDVWLDDLGSTNGTYVNEQRIADRTPLSTADTLRIGRSVMKLEA